MIRDRSSADPLTPDDDLDEDSWGFVADCDDDDDTTYPGAPDPWYDGTDSDCVGDSDFDQDRDGHDTAASGGDDLDDIDPSCWDTCMMTVPEVEPNDSLAASTPRIEPPFALTGSLEVGGIDFAGILAASAGTMPRRARCPLCFCHFRPNPRLRPGASRIRCHPRRSALRSGGKAAT